MVLSSGTLDLLFFLPLYFFTLYFFTLYFFTFKNKASLQNKQGFFRLQTSPVCKVKKPCF